jgi:ferritin-like metal-binding protein YciE
MADSLSDKLIGYVQDAHAMECSVVRMLDSMIGTTTDPEILARLTEHRRETDRHVQLLEGRLTEHRRETDRHVQLLEGRLTALGKGRSRVADTAAVAAALLKSVGDRVRHDRPGKNARDAFVVAHEEIATYELLERLAMRAGDGETARVAREIRRDEEEMAHWIASHWDRFLDLTLAESGIASRAPAHIG